MDKLEEIKSNINSIKSSYILKLVFSFLNEEQKMKIIIYNKQIQKKLDVNIEVYKKISGRYKIGEKNGKGKEYKLGIDKMIYKGEYLNGKKNGKGKEYYYNGKLKFEGEYLNGKKNGKGKEYYINDRLIFEGEYLNGKRWNGKGYNKKGNIELEIKDGNGKGKEYNYDGKLLFEGEYLNGKRNGKRKRV